MECFGANCILGPTRDDASVLLAATDGLGIGRARLRRSRGARYGSAWANALLAQPIAAGDRLTPCWAGISPGMAEREAVAQAVSNAYGGISGPPLARAAHERMVADVCVERILFGTAMSWLGLSFQIGKVAYARLIAEEQRLILGENATRLMGWN